jgi:streptogramin lyase
VPALAAALSVFAPSAATHAALQPRLQRNSIVVINVATRATVLAVPLRSEPLRVTYGAGKLWAVAPKSRLVVAVDPRTRRVRRWKIGEEPYDVAVGGGAAWIPDHDGAKLWRLDLTTGKTAPSALVDGPELASAYAFGAVWVVGADHNLRRFDPRTLKVTSRIAGVSASVEGYEPKIAADRNSLWVADAVLNAVVRVDPKSLRVTYRNNHGGAGVAVNRFGVWSTDSFHRVWRVARGRLTSVTTGSGAIDVAADARSLWVVNRFDRTLVQIDARRLRVTHRIRLSRPPFAVAASAGFVAVAVH